MKIYLAAAFSRRQELAEFAKTLDARGHEITARWLEEDTSGRSGYDRIDWAVRDVEDIDRAEVLVRFTDPECRINDGLPTGTAPAYLMTGSRMWETGYAYAKGKQIIVVGGKQNIFDNLSAIQHVDNIEELGALIG